MAAIILPTVWNRQPPAPLDIDRGNPLTRGIIFVSHGGASGYDPITRTFPTTTGSGITYGGVGPSGKAEVFSGSGYREYAHADSLIFGNGYSVLSVARTTSLASQSGMVAKWSSGAGSDVPMTFFVRASGELALWRNVGGTNNGTCGTTTTDGGTTGTSVISTNQDFVASVDTGGTVHSPANFYVNGYRRFSGFTFGPSGSDVALAEPTTSKFAVGTSNGGASIWVGNIYLTICWNRRLTSKEHSLLHANPWQIFQPTARRIFVQGASGVYTLTSDAGSYALAGQDATLNKNSVLTADAGSYSLSGQDATLSWAGAGAFTLTADAGSYALSGQDATLTWTSPGAYVLTADAGSYTMSGQAATLLKSKVITADAGAYSFSGQAATLTKASAAAYTLTANAGSYILQGQTAVLTNSGEVITTTAPTEPNSIDWGALVAKTWGKDYVKPEWDYEFSNGRRFLEKKNPYA